MTTHNLPEAADVALVSFALSPARHGWIKLLITAGDQSDDINCSDVYDPFEDLARMVTLLAQGQTGSIEIDEEGCATQIRVDREPGSFLGRLRVFEPSETGSPEHLIIDKTVDVLQLALDFHDALSAYAGTYDAEHWDTSFGKTKPAPRVLADIDLRYLAATLGSFGLNGSNETSETLRAAYVSELGDRALPVA